MAALEKFLAVSNSHCRSNGRRRTGTRGYETRNQGGAGLKPITPETDETELKL